MSTDLVKLNAGAAFKICGNGSNTLGKNLPMRKRKKEHASISGNVSFRCELIDCDAEKRQRLDGSEDHGVMGDTQKFDNQGLQGTKEVCDSGEHKSFKHPPVSRARAVRLEQNRKAARESRRRKKVMIEELQRSVIFFLRANSTLKQQNNELHRFLVQAQSQIHTIEQGGESVSDVVVSKQTAVSEAIENSLDGQCASTAPDTGFSTVVPQHSATHVAQQIPAQVPAATGQSQFLTKARTKEQVNQTTTANGIYEFRGFSPGAPRAASCILVSEQSIAVSDPKADSSLDDEKKNTLTKPVVAQQLMQQVPHTVVMPPNPFMAAMMGMPIPSSIPTATTAAPGNVSHAPATSNAMPTYMNSFNQFAMQQHWFAAQMSAMSAIPAIIPGIVATGPSFFPHVNPEIEWGSSMVTATSANSQS